MTISQLAMAFRNFPGTDEAWLLARRTEVVNAIISGTRLVGWGDGSASATKLSFSNLHPERLRDMIQADLYAIDPLTYPAEDLAIRATTATLGDR